VRSAPAASRGNENNHTSIVTTGSPETPGLPCAMVLTVSFVLSPVTGLFCHRRLADPSSAKLDASVGASGPHDFSVRVSVARVASPSRPLHPHPTSVTIAIRPSWRARDVGEKIDDLGSASSDRVGNRMQQNAT
jgi:hypothetical protein